MDHHGGMDTPRLPEERGSRKERAGVLQHGLGLPCEGQQRPRLPPRHRPRQTDGYAAPPLVGLDVQDVPRPLDVSLGAEPAHRQLVCAAGQKRLAADDAPVDVQGELPLHQHGLLQHGFFEGRAAIDHPAGCPYPHKRLRHAQPPTVTP